MTKTAAQVYYLQRTLNISFGMLASLLEVTATRLSLWVEGKDHENPKFDRVSDLYGIIDIAVKYGIPENVLFNMLDEPISGGDEGVSLLCLNNSLDKGSTSLFPGFDDELLGYLDFLERFKTSLNLEVKNDG